MTDTIDSRVVSTDTLPNSTIAQQSCVTFTCDTKVFPVSDESATVYYDEGMQQVLVVRWKATYAMVYMMSFTRQWEELVFRLPNTQIINSIKLSKDLRVAAVHRSMCVVDFFDPDDDTGPIHAIAGRYANSKILRFYWLHTRDFVLITENTVELHQLSADGRSSKMVKYYGLTLDWSVFSHSAQFLVVCSASHPSLHTYSFQTEGSVTRHSRVDCLNSYQTSGSIHEHLSERDISIFQVYDQLYVTRVRNQVQRGNQHGMEVDMFRVTKEAALKEYVLYWNLAPQANTTRIFALTSDDNHIIVHHQASKTCAVFDILHSETDLNTKTIAGSVLSGSKSSLTISRSPSALHSRGPSNVGSTPRIRSTSSSRSLVINTVKFVYPLVKGQPPHAAMGQTLPDKVYSGGWALFQPNIGLDAQQGRLWRISVCVEGVCASIAEAAERVDYLLRRSNSKCLLINCARDCFAAETVDQQMANNIKSPSYPIRGPITTPATSNHERKKSRSPSRPRPAVQVNVNSSATTTISPNKPVTIASSTRRELLMELLVSSLAKWQTQEAAHQRQDQQQLNQVFSRLNLVTYSKPAPGGYSALPWQSVTNVSRNRRSAIHASSPVISPSGTSPTRVAAGRSPSRSRPRTTSDELNMMRNDSAADAQTSETATTTECMYTEDSHGTNTAEMLLTRLRCAIKTESSKVGASARARARADEHTAEGNNNALPEGMSQERRTCDVCCQRLGLARDTAGDNTDEQSKDDGNKHNQSSASGYERPCICTSQARAQRHIPATAHVGGCGLECDKSLSLEHSIAQQVRAERRVIPVMLQMDMLDYIFRPLVCKITTKNRRHSGKRMIHMLFQFRRALVGHGIAPLPELDAEISSLLIRLCQVQRLTTVLRSKIIRPSRLVLWTILTTPISKHWVPSNAQTLCHGCTTLNGSDLDLQSSASPARVNELYCNQNVEYCTCILHRDLHQPCNERYSFATAEMMLYLKDSPQVLQQLLMNQTGLRDNSTLILRTASCGSNPLMLYNIVEYYERVRNRIRADNEKLREDADGSTVHLDNDPAGCLRDFEQYRALARERCACLGDQ
ncbi:hypothetical protein SARC_02481 [Sphaeroforma arctica JP610]|uniref:Regulator of MON1-CCZ1 complex N-terminal domain-containing protein n=1 Tax=Sphaeroforma arctica JP610 TaxID=667725 RepID=A0A0L0G8U3_9EUKA|nr:hypothetical protein SARC_02481 [Sphaeroforma arctica JP610]KNC85334.1 hypothetical protein SARC_02481 [Sphaeroforma arctica JP610]|eukprot:XP_014159236.1 hypothetical protein SARC_02481 [Sphaeroforma arctica JP610]